MTTELPKETAKRPRWQRWLGIKRRDGRFLRWGVTKWGAFLVLVIFGMVGMAAFGEYSMKPDFCQSCHIMQPYYDAWHQSTHGKKNVACVDCHFEPGLLGTMYGKFQASSQVAKYVTRTYGSKPHAEIRDVSCLREGCHETRLLQGKVNWTIQTESGKDLTIHFDHTPHLQMERRGKHLRCISCHGQMVQGKHIVVTTEACFLCHFKGLKHGRDDQTIGTCKGCHEAPKGTIEVGPNRSFTHADYVNKGVKCENCHSDTVRGDGSVPQQVCWNCHNQPRQLEKYSDPKLLHKEHVTDHKVDCSSCHVQIEHSLVAGAREESTPHARFSIDSGTCGQCHEQTHAGPREMFRGIGGRGVPNMPSPMARARVNCIGCHTQRKIDGQTAEVSGQTFVATQERCDYCHGNKYPTTLADWKQAVTKGTTAAEVSLLDARNKLAKVKADAKITSEIELKVLRLLDDADYNVRFVKLARGVHNPTYATALLSEATRMCDEAKELIAGKKAPTTAP